MSGIIFLNTKDLDKIKAFYQLKLEMLLWLDQGDCAILKHGNLLLGFCKGKSVPFSGLITFFYETKEEVDSVYHELGYEIDSPPKINETFNIYHFFAHDPEGRRLEFQCFLHPLEPYMAGDELLLLSQEVQRFEEREVPQAVLRKIFALCRYPTSSSESSQYTLSVIRSRERREALIPLIREKRESAETSPVMIVVSSNRKVTVDLLEQIFSSAYHFSLAARLYGLASNRIDDMDHDGMKDLLGMNEEDQIFMTILVGYPDGSSPMLNENPITSRVHFVD
jgi:catechol 2,3-dioxygenase-like lactoylglutathione lyase family enzyme